MAADEAYGLGYEQVDDDPNVAVLLATMDATARWEATRRLRAWEREHLLVVAGRRLLDVGCGAGDAALALARDLDHDGELVGIDKSAEMIRAAQAKAGSVSCRVRFDVGDAACLQEPDGHFDAVRAERTLQWLPDPVAALGEMSRVMRPGGRLSLIDTDWSTLSIDVGDDDLSARVSSTMQTERGRPSNIGRRLHELAGDAGLVPLAATKATHTWNSWDPDECPAPDGFFSMRSLAEDLVAADQLAPTDAERFVATVHDAARSGRFAMSLTMHAIVAAAPSK